MSQCERTRIEREELFKQVWQQSMVQLAQEYGLSDVGLRKICKRLNVPTPPQGYWARKYRKGAPKLPPTQGPTYHEQVIDLSKPEPSSDVNVTLHIMPSNQLKRATLKGGPFAYLNT